MLRAAGVLLAVSHLGGGQATATRYRVDVAALRVLCGATWLDEFMRGQTGNGAAQPPETRNELSRNTRGKMSHCNANVGTCLSQDSERPAGAPGLPTSGERGGR